MIPPWQPTATPARLQARAALLRQLREFFHQRGVLEVETPLMVRGTTPEPHITPLAVTLPHLPPEASSGWLLSSPEAPMKRLLAAGSGPIYQLTRAFRADDEGPLHNPEFTILEWYRPGWSMAALMAEVGALAAAVLGLSAPPAVISYREAFRRFAGLDPFTHDAAGVAAHARAVGLQPPAGLAWEEGLDFLQVMRVEPGLKAAGGGWFITGFPASRAAMAEVDPGPPATARRFELYVDGVELANGYQELTEAGVQRQRLEAANDQRRRDGLSPLPLDERFLAALDAGLPPCAGVALGVDRLLLLQVGAGCLQEVLAFPFSRA